VPRPAAGVVVAGVVAPRPVVAAGAVAPRPAAGVADAGLAPRAGADVLTGVAPLAFKRFLISSVILQSLLE
jgi:hypothetical protein